MSKNDAALKALLERIREKWADCEHADEDDQAEAEAAGLIHWREVTQEDFDQHSFPEEAGIEVGGQLVELTPAGRALISKGRPHVD